MTVLLRRSWPPLLVAIGMGYLFSASGFAVAADTFWAGRWWTVWFAVVGLITIAFAFFPWSERLYVASGWMGVVAWASRAVGLIVDKIGNGFQAADGRIAVGLFVYTLTAVGLNWFWQNDVRTWHLSERQRHEARDDARHDQRRKVR